MRSSFVALLSLIASAAAYQVTYPGGGDKWYAGAVTNTFKWERVSTDAESFTLVLTSEDRSVLPVNNQQLIATVPGSTGEVEVPAPSGGFPVGKFRVNIVKSPTEVTTILAQSPEFEIVAGTGTTSGTLSATSSVSRSVVIVSPTSAGTTPTTSNGPDPTNTAGSSNGAMSIIARGSPAMIAGALAAAFMA
ncbi:hypothetical protein OPQ81_009715 [Rhizoctonia solani]|nr:hypothetical protein OPQ81_009715 [Rhizoctonia solani]